MSDTIRLNWVIVKGASTYNIYHSLQTGLSVELTSVLANTADLTFDHTGLSSPSTHYYIIAAVGPNGEIGPQSNEIALTINTSSPVITFNLLNTAQSDTASITINTPATASNDFLVAMLAGQSTNANRFMWTPPSGWSYVSSMAETNGGTGHNNSQNIFIRKVGSIGSEPSTYTFDKFSSPATSTMHTVAAIASYSSVNINSPINVLGLYGIDIAGSGNAPGITTSAALTKLITMFSADTIQSLASPGGTTIGAETNSDAPVCQLLMTTQDILVAGSVGTKSSSTTDMSQILGINLALQPTGTSSSNFNGYNIANNGFATTITLAVPTSAQVGDTLIAAIMANTSSTGSPDEVIDLPAGWTLINRYSDDDATNMAFISCYKVVSGGDPSSYTWTYHPPFGHQVLGVITVYTGLGAFVNTAKTGTAFTSNFGSVSASTTAQPSLLIKMFASSGFDGLASTSGFGGNFRTSVVDSFGNFIYITDSNFNDGTVSIGGVSAYAAGNNTAVTTLTLGAWFIVV